MVANPLRHQSCLGAGPRRQRPLEILVTFLGLGVTPQQQIHSLFPAVRDHPPLRFTPVLQQAQTTRRAPRGQPTPKRSTTDAQFLGNMLAPRLARHHAQRRRCSTIAWGPRRKFTSSPGGTNVMPLRPLAINSRCRRRARASTGRPLVGLGNDVAVSLGQAGKRNRSALA